MLRFTNHDIPTQPTLSPTARVSIPTARVSGPREPILNRIETNQPTNKHTKLFFLHTFAHSTSKPTRHRRTDRARRADRPRARLR